MSHSDGPLFAFSLFTPTIINQVSVASFVGPREMWQTNCARFSLVRTRDTCAGNHADPGTGFKATAANLLSVPVYAWACLITLFIGILGDRIGHRGYINL